MLTVLMFCIWFGLALFAFVLLFMRASRKIQPNKVTLEVEDRFKKLSVTSDDPCRAFEGATAITVYDLAVVDKKPGKERAILNRICRNPAGEYFHVITSSDDGGVSIEHMTLERAVDMLNQAELDIKPPNLNAVEALSLSSVESPLAVTVSEGAEVCQTLTSRHWTDVARFPLATGAGLMLVFIIAVSVASGNPLSVNLIKLSYLIVDVFAVLFVVLIVLKAWLGEEFKPHNWFLRTANFVVRTCYGVVLVAILYDIFVWMLMRK